MKAVFLFMLIFFGLNLYAEEVATDCPYSRDGDAREAETSESSSVKADVKTKVEGE